VQLSRAAYSLRAMRLSISQRGSAAAVEALGSSAAR